MRSFNGDSRARASSRPWRAWMVEPSGVTRLPPEGWVAELWTEKGAAE